MKKCISATIVSLLLATPVYAVEWGLGASTKSDDNAIYFPVKATDTLRIEPFLRQLKQEEDDDGRKSNYETFNIGIGLFSIANIKDKSHFYYGARASYTETKTKWQHHYGDSKTKSYGYTLSPTIGFEYFITDKISIGAEAEWAYFDTSGSETNNGVKTDREFTETDTNTRILIRYLF